MVWAEQGTTDLHWEVPRAVDSTAAAVTGAALLTTSMLGIVNRRKGLPTDLDRSRPVSEAVGVFADTVDGWVHAAARKMRSLGERFR